MAARKNLLKIAVMVMAMAFACAEVSDGRRYRMVKEVNELGFLRVYPVREDEKLERTNGTSYYSTTPRHETSEVPEVTFWRSPFRSRDPSLLSSAGTPKCGVPAVSRMRIIGGNVASEDKYPWQTLLQAQSGDSRGSYTSNCGGAMISPVWVITAAHCLEMSIGPTPIPVKKINVFIGAHDMSRSDTTDSRIRVEALTWKQHEGWNPRSSMKHDLGLVKIPDITGKAKPFMPICLPSKDEVDTKIECLTTGWGLTAAEEKGGRTSSVLKALATYTMDPDACKVSSQTMLYFYLPSMLCIDPKGGRHTVCKGDSGGPLLKWKNDHYVLIGLTSFGSNNGCEAPEPPAFTRVRYYVDYICSKTGVCP